MHTFDNKQEAENQRKLSDHSPHLGSVGKGESVFELWLEKHQCLTIGRQLLAATPTAGNLLLLGGALSFLTHRQTQSVLKRWAETGLNQILLGLERLSTSLSLDFPNLEAPPPSQPIALLFHGQNVFTRLYLAACICTRRPPHQTEQVKEGFASLKLWLLLKSSGFAQTGTVHDQSIRVLSNHLRMALDGSHPTKFQALLPLARPVASVSRFEQHLRMCLLELKANPDSWAKDSARAIEKLLLGERTPIPEFQDTAEIIWPEEVETSPGYSSQSPPEMHELAELAPEDATAFSGVEEPTSNPIQRLRLTTAVALQTMEDRQYLPWSWNRLNPSEQLVLSQKLKEWSSGANPQLRLVAAMAQIAILTRSSLVTVQGLRLGATPQEDWSLDLELGEIHRTAPRRAVRWKASRETGHWVKPLAQEWRFQLAPDIAKPLRQAFRRTAEPLLLGQLWTDPTQTPAQCFNHFCRASPGLERVSSGLLNTTAEQLVFSSAEDAVLARLVTAPPSAGITGAGAYPSWSMQQASAAINAVSTDLKLMLATTDVNGVGSELDPDDQLLSDAFAKVGKRIESLGEQDHWIHAHNLITSYTLALLLAATGARPARSMFESIAHFDLQVGRLYLDDKANARGVTGHSGRIVPIPEAICTWMKYTYIPHLEQLSNHVLRFIPELGREMANQAKGLGSDKLPLFVFLRDIQGFDWQEVSESALNALQIFEWPLPWNLFRHRLATRARSLGLDPELIDAQLGHSEGGSETFGDFSPRCWTDEEPAWRKAIEEAFELLAISVPAVAKVEFTPIQTDTDYRPFTEGQFFGIRARQVARTVQHDHATQAARHDAQRYLASRNKEAHQLSTDEWMELGRSMLFRERNLPHSNATLRYEVFEQLAARAWRDHGTRAPVKNLIRQLPPGRGGFGPDSLTAHHAVQTLKNTIDRQFKQVVPSKLGKVEAAWMATIDLAVYGKVANPDLLEAVLQPWKGSRIELLVMNGRSYIDIGAPSNEIGGRSPVQRFPIPARSLMLLETAKSLGRSPSVFPPPDWLAAALTRLGCPHSQSADQALKWLAYRIDAANRLCSPGLIAGMLAGRVSSYALWAEDWSRVANGMAVIHPLHPPETESECGSLTNLRAAPSPKPVTQDERNKRNRQFIAAIRKQLDSAKDAKAESTSNGGLSDRRRKVLGAIKQLLNTAPAGISRSTFALGEWVAHLLERPRHKSGVLTYSTISRYLGALSSGFLAFGEEIDLSALDEDELEDFYLLVIDPTLAVMDESAAHESSGAEEVEELADDGEKAKENQRYVLMRLKEFHSFAMRRYGLPAIDWSQLDQGLTGVLGRPGLITWGEYVQTLRVLCSDPGHAGIEEVRAAFILLLCYRFGLRGIEAVSLSRGDWVEPTRGVVVVLVRGTLRKLKTRASLRQVPLISTLTEFEREIIDIWFDHWNANDRQSHRLPLFFDESDHKCVVDVSPIRRTINTALKQVTGSPHTTLHHARHTFANVLMSCLIEGLVSRDPNYLLPEILNPNSVKKLILGTERVTRRLLWGVARSLGHSQLSTTLGSYIHLLQPWHESHLIRDQSTMWTITLDRLFDATSTLILEKWAPVCRAQNIIISSKPKNIINPITPQLEIQYLWFRSRQVTPKIASKEVNMHTSDAHAIEDKLCRYSAILFVETKQLDASLHAGLLLSKIASPEWEALKKIVAAAKSQVSKHTWTDHLTKNRQILLWRPSHFQLFQNFLNSLNLIWSDFTAYSTRNLHASLLKEVRERNIQISPTLVKPEDYQITRIKRFQIDVVSEIQEEGMRFYPKDRISLVPSRNLGISSFGVALLLFICQN